MESCDAYSWKMIGGSWRVTFVVALAFLPKNFGKGGRDLQMIFHQSVSAVLIVSTPVSGSDTQTLTTVIKFV